jgi:phenylalanyl-tRNA synthetase beta chain
MKLPLIWLHDYATPDLDARALAPRLAMTGTEVDHVHHHGVEAVEHFVVGRVLTAEQHPDADRLRVCTVDVGDGEPKQIVCGAPNVAAGQTVAVARPGAVMPDGTKLKKAKLRGVESDGMILAEDEVSLGSDHAGIMVLDELLVDAELAPGAPLEEFLAISTEVLELEITPNRPDCLGVYGVAREVHAATGAELAPPPWEDDPGRRSGERPLGSIEGVAEVVVEVPDLCPRFTARVFEDVKLGPSPLWLKARLSAAGQRPINNVVDITNFVMLLTGQPLHAFDLDRVAGAKLTVRRARDGETMTTLDDIERTLDPDMVLIEDADGPTSIAGVMGGARSEVHEGTTRVLMEVANWNGPNINRTMARLALRTEAGARFEKGLAPEQAMEAQAVATRLMVQLCGARLVEGTIDVGGPGPDPAVIRLRDARIASLLGAPVERATSARVLEGLGFGVTEAEDGLDVTVPAFRRNDVTREADLIEEVARLAALDGLPATIPENRTGRAARLTPAQRLRRRAEDVLVGAGLHEIVGWSFASPDLLDRLRLPAGHPLREVVAIENPMSQEQAIMRPTILGSLLDVAAHNVSHGNPDVALFESGTVYRRAAHNGLADEHHALAALLHGRIARKAWDGPEPPSADFFAAKGLVEAVAGALRAQLACEPAEWPFLHPGRSAVVLSAAGERLGFVGEVHPLVAQAWDLEGAVAAFAIDLGRLTALAPADLHYRDVTSFPAVRQDLAVVVADDVPAAKVVELVRAYASDAEVFDVYRGAQLGEGRKSLALHCTFQAGDRTLTDEEVAAVREKLVARLAGELGGELRG